MNELSPDQNKISHLDCFFETLNRHLKDKNLSLVAKKVGMPKSMLHDWVKGRRIPSLASLNYIDELARYLQIPLLDLLMGKDHCQSFKNLFSGYFMNNDQQFEIVINEIPAHSELELAE